MKFSKGNKKIGKDTIIFNITPAYLCPSDKLGLCNLSKKCYAKKAEKQYHHVVPQHRKKQMHAWDTESVTKIYKDICKKVKNARIHKINYIRFSEAGDFKSQSDIEKLKLICEMLLENECTKHLIVYGYTNRSDLVFKDLPNNLIINGTNFMISNEFIPVERNTIDKYKNICVGDCRICNKCKKANKRKIYVAIH